LSEPVAQVAGVDRGAQLGVVVEIDMDVASLPERRAGFRIF
jgi:hypothetical protein